MRKIENNLKKKKQQFSWFSMFKIKIVERLFSTKSTKYLKTNDINTRYMLFTNL